MNWEGLDGAWLLPSSHGDFPCATKEVIDMTDYEIISLVIEIMILVIAAISCFKNK